MKLLTENEMVDLLPAPPELAAIARGKYSFFVDRSLEPAAFDRAIANGWLKETVISFNGEPAYVLWTSVSGNGSLIVEGIGSVKVNSSPERMATGVELLARQLGCKAIMVPTQRPGIVEIGRRTGYKVTGVLMEKRLCS